MEKTIRKFIVLLAAIAFFTSCDQKKQQLKEHIAGFNEECPISFGEIMTINGVSFEDNRVTMKISFNENFATVSALKSHKEAAKENLCLSLTKSSSETFLNAIIDAGVDFRTVFVGNQSGTRAEFMMNASELKTAKNKYQNMTEGQKLIVSTVLGAKIHLPKQVDEITTMTNVSITSNALVYDYEVNDREYGKNLSYSMSVAKAITQSQMAGSIKYGALAERNRQLYKALIDCGQHIKVNYYERNTGNRASFEISVSEMRDILNGKYQENAMSESDWNDLANALDELEDIYGEMVDTTATVEYEEIDY